MLAFMPQTPPLPVHTPTASSTMSLAILPSAPMAYNQSSVLAPSPPPAKKPKLSLNTSNVPAAVFGKGSTSLRLDTLSATSPTTRNTFRNAYNQAQAQQTSTLRPQKPRLAPLATNVSISNEPASHIDQESCHDSAASSASTSSISSVDFSTAEAPYRLTFNVTSILKNGPLPRKRIRRMSFSQSKPMFPAAKKVAFRAPNLAEDIETTKYTMKHSDIESSASTISTLELSPPEDKPTEVDIDHKDDTIAESDVVVAKKEPTSPRAGDKRESSDEEDDSDSCPATPVAGRKKRHREWRWTLGPVNPSTEQQETQPSELEANEQDKAV